MTKFPAGMSSCHGRRRSFACALVVGVACLFGVLHSEGQTLQDNFTNRLTLTSTTGQITQNNSNATVEANEPRHGGKVGGHSLWISWVAPTNGVIRFKTEASGFDTVMSAYRFDTTNGSTFGDLREVARADDSEGFGRESEVEFGVITGERYEIAVDGYQGTTGKIEFQWDFDEEMDPPPQFLNTLPDRSVNIGEAVSLSFIVTNAGAGNLKWYFNGNELAASSTNLNIASFSPTNVGRYKLRVALGGGVQFYSVPVEIQINTDGAPDTLAQPKILDAPDSPLIGSAGRAASRPGPLSSGVVRGYNGSQIFDTSYALVDTNEPAHCSVTSSKSYWLVYQPPTNGTITLDTLGSSYDTVMEAYTYNGTITNYQSLISLDCANDSFPSNSAARLVLPVVKSRQYVVVVAGVNGAAGTAWLNYTLNTNLPPQPPALTSNPAPQSAAVGSTVVLNAPVSGAPPMVFSWTWNGVPIQGQNSAALVLTDLIASQAGDYAFTVTNDVGSVTGTFTLKVIVPPWLKLTPIPTGLQLSFPTLVGQNYTIEETSDLLAAWWSWPGTFVGNGLTNYFNVPVAGLKFYRIRTE